MDRSIRKLLIAIAFCGLISFQNIILVTATTDDKETKQDDADSAFVDDEKPKTRDTSLPDDVHPETGLQASIDADVTFAFTRPVIDKPYEFPIGKEVHFLVGFKNKGQKEFNINSIGASFRYAQDFSYALQNFSTISFDKAVEPSEEATFGYSFFINEAYLPRSYGFVVDMLYADKDGVQYQNTVFNHTVSLVEIYDGLDGESIFLFIILGGLLMLALYGLNTMYIKYFGISRRSAPKVVESEKFTINNEVDYDWLPNTVTGNLKKTSVSKKASAN